MSKTAQWWNILAISGPWGSLAGCSRCMPRFDVALAPVYVHATCESGSFYSGKETCPDYMALPQRTTTFEPAAFSSLVRSREPIDSLPTRRQPQFVVALRGILVSSVTVVIIFMRFVMDFMPFLCEFKMQPTDYPALGQYDLKVALVNQTVVHIPFLGTLLTFWGVFSVLSTSQPLPTLPTIAFEFTMSIVCDAFFIY
ncbi:Aste57867_21556 [Aphanomyces stellatus]|uniref:Aste57867_21556 protein n=1 Tax=Aphanomyces stellatus TaxID=120398 RepID=A0A485LJ75_9STRA|nr:hypothetical protein As57867_021487 [Aphanomyces stellatus]VFT98226.1 Aste57867_21556 [Aphanomyces stellatus]